MDRDTLNKMEEDWSVVSQQLRLIKQQNNQFSNCVDYVLTMMAKQLAHEKLECLTEEENKTNE